MDDRIKLVCGVTRHRESPTTFQIPSNFDINMLSVGDLVKIGFTKDGKNDERMWVEITDIDHQNWFIGTLDNDPFFIDMKLGDAVHFEARNIIGIKSKDA